jgi:hypothetical protein
VKVLGVADSDSYTKWGASLLTRMPAEWQRSLTILRTPALPSDAQLAAVLAGTAFSVDATPQVDLSDLAALIRRERPDVVLLSVRGPVVRVLVRMIAASAAQRPLIVSGLPGISIPATLLALYYRSQVDLLILHSKREIAAFRSLADHWGIEQDFGLATLPFLSRSQNSAVGDDIVFAAQAKVPRTLIDRQLLVEWLVEAARQQPDRRVVLKLRAAAGESQTHAERHPLDEILATIPDVPDNLVVSTGSMSAHLERAAALVTVSSTAALEAAAMGVPVLALDGFGVSASMINLVFDDSGILGSSDDLIAGRYRNPDAGWLDENYFHEASDDTWISAIEVGVRRRAESSLPLRSQFRGTLGGNLRRVWDRKRALGPYDRSLGGYLALGVGLPLRGAVRKARAIRARVLGSPPTEVSVVRSSDPVGGSRAGR